MPVSASRKHFRAPIDLDYERQKLRSGSCWQMARQPTTDTITWSCTHSSRLATYQDGILRQQQLLSGISHFLVPSQQKKHWAQ